MTAKTKHGHKAHRRTHGADEGSAHERLNRAHAVPNRAEGAPMSSASSGGAPPPSPIPQAPPMGAGAVASPGAAGPSTDSEAGDET